MSSPNRYPKKKPSSHTTTEREPPPPPPRANPAPLIPPKTKTAHDLKAGKGRKTTFVSSTQHPPLRCPSILASCNNEAVYAYGSPISSFTQGKKGPSTASRVPACRLPLPPQPLSFPTTAQTSRHQSVATLSQTTVPRRTRTDGRTDGWTDAQVPSSSHTQKYIS